ncbi:hypothetical protein BH10ACI4_BH10ACI4_25090 [soil metagenome]
MKVFPASERVHTAEHPEGELPISMKREGWRLTSDGMYTFRYKTLCESCIGLETQREESRRYYLKACEALKPSKDQTYAQLLLSQDNY